MSTETMDAIDGGAVYLALPDDVRVQIMKAFDTPSPMTRVFKILDEMTTLGEAQKCAVAKMVPLNGLRAPAAAAGG